VCGWESVEGIGFVSNKGSIYARTGDLIEQYAETCRFCVFNRQSHPLYRPGQFLGLQKLETPRISRKSVHEGCKVVSPTIRPPLPPPPGTHLCL